VGCVFLWFSPYLSFCLSVCLFVDKLNITIQHFCTSTIHVPVWQIPDAVDTVVCAPDDGWKYHPKHVEKFPYINKLCDVASCWLYEYIGILLGARPILHISRIKVKLTQIFEFSRRLEICLSVHYHMKFIELDSWIHSAERTKQGKCPVLYFYIFLTVVTCFPVIYTR
jgi:hypothetical protein